MALKKKLKGWKKCSRNEYVFFFGCVRMEKQNRKKNVFIARTLFSRTLFIFKPIRCAGSLKESATPLVRYSEVKNFHSSLQKIVFPEKVEKTVPRENAKISKKKQRQKKKFFFFFFEIGLVLETTCSSSEKFFFLCFDFWKKILSSYFFWPFPEPNPSLFSWFLRISGFWRPLQAIPKRQ